MQRPILVVDDTWINQKIIIGMLKKVGLETETANDGREALEALGKQDFGMILMDCQMPEMDGYEATRVIRQREVGTGKHIPIIAMTAYAMAGDREKCLFAGMDDYLAKPVKAELLYQALEKWLQVKSDEEDGATMQPLAVGKSIDVARLTHLRSSFGEGGDEFLREVIQKYLIDMRGHILHMLQGVKVDDYETITRIAHKVSSSSGIVGAVEMAEELKKLEMAGRSGAFDLMSGILGRVVEEWEACRSELEKIVSEGLPQ